MVAYVVDVGLFLLAVLLAGEDAADVGLAHGAGAQSGRVGQQCLQELDGDNLVALKLHRLGGEHAHVLQTLHVGEVALAEGHEEADALHAGDVLGQALDLLVVEQVHILLAHLVEVVLPLDAHGGDFHPVAVLPVGAGGGHLPQVHFGVEVGGEGIAVVAAVAVQDVDGVDLVEQVLLGVGAVGLGDAGVKAGAQQSGEAGLLELLLVGPLVGVVEVGGETLLLAALLVVGAPGGVGEVLGLVVGGIQVVDAALQAGVHNGQILVGQGDVHHQVGLVLPDKGCHLGCVVGVHLGGGDTGLGLALQVGLEGIALGFGAGGDADVGEQVIALAALADGHVGHTAAADDENFAHEKHSLSVAGRDESRYRSFHFALSIERWARPRGAQCNEKI